MCGLENTALSDVTWYTDTCCLNTETLTEYLALETKHLGRQNKAAVLVESWNEKEKSNI